MAKKGKLHGKAKATFLRRMKKGRMKHRKKNPFGLAAMVRKAKRSKKARKMLAGLRSIVPKKKRFKRRKKLAGAALMAHLKKLGKKFKRGKKGAAKMAKKKRKSKSRKRSLAAKKAARTRKYKKAKRVAAGKKAARKRKHGKKAYHKKSRRRRRHRRSAALTIRRIKPRRWRVVRRPKGKTKAARRARSFIRRHKLRIKNPFGGGGIMGGVISLVKAAAPIGVGYFLSKMGAANLHKVPVVGGLVAKAGRFAGPAGALAVVLGMSFVTKKVNALGKYKQSLMIGAGLALLEQIIGATPLGGYLGAPSVAAALPGSTSDYIETAAYEEQAAYEEAADYIQTDDYVETAGVHDLHDRSLGAGGGTPMLPGGDAGYYAGVFSGGFGN